MADISRTSVDRDDLAQMYGEAFLEWSESDDGDLWEHVPATD